MVPTTRLFPFLAWLTGTGWFGGRGLPYTFPGGCSRLPSGSRSHQGPWSNGKKQVKALVSMGCKYSPDTQEKKETGQIRSRAFPVQEAPQQPDHQPREAPPLQSPCLNGRGDALTQFCFLKRCRDCFIKILSVILVLLSFCTLFFHPNYLKRERGLEQLWEPLAMAYKAHLLSALSYAFLPPPPSQPHHNHYVLKAQTEHPSKGLLSHDFLTATVALGYREPSSPFDRVPRAKE